jgi:acyl-homoserine lactone synthase
VEKLGWEAIRRPDGLEIDEFDTDSAIHVIVQDGDKIGAYARLLPTTQPHLLSVIYPTLLDDAAKLPVGDDILEWTRSTALPIKATPGSAEDTTFPGLGLAFDKAGQTLFLGIVEWGLDNGVKAYSFQGDPAFVVVMEAMGARAEFLAQPKTTAEGKSIVAMLMHVSEATRAKMRELFGMKDGCGKQNRVILRLNDGYEFLWCQGQIDESHIVPVMRAMRTVQNSSIIHQTNVSTHMLSLHCAPIISLSS